MNEAPAIRHKATLLIVLYHTGWVQWVQCSCWWSNGGDLYRINVSLSVGRSGRPDRAAFQPASSIIGPVSHPEDMDLSNILAQIQGFVGPAGTAGPSSEAQSGSRSVTTSAAVTAVRSGQTKKTAATQSNITADATDTSTRIFAGIIIFSKDRPYQLSQLLQSMLDNITDVHSSEAADLNRTGYTVITVLYHPGAYAREYELVKRMFATLHEREGTIGESRSGYRVVFVAEVNPFQLHLRECLQHIQQCAHAGPALTSVMFLVDDLLFYAPVNIRYSVWSHEYFYISCD
jgi:hypothetical protein